MGDLTQHPGIQHYDREIAKALAYQPRTADGARAQNNQIHALQVGQKNIDGAAYC
jgi:hypothetical protein